MPAAPPVASFVDSPSAASIERELSSLTSTVETPAPDVDGAGPASRGAAAAAAGAVSAPQGAGPAGPASARTTGERAELPSRDVPPSMPTPRVDALGGGVEALRAWLVPSPDGARLLAWAQARPPGAIEVVVLATQAGANLRTLLS